MKAVISEVKKPYELQPKKSGGTFGPAMLVEVELEDGQAATMFVWEDKAIGDELEVEKKGEYWNVVSKKSQQDNEKHDDIMKALRYIFDDIKKIKEHLEIK